MERDPKMLTCLKQRQTEANHDATDRRRGETDAGCAGPAMNRDFHGGSIERYNVTQKTRTQRNVSLICRSTSLMNLNQKVLITRPALARTAKASSFLIHLSPVSLGSGSTRKVHHVSMTVTQVIDLVFEAFNTVSSWLSGAAALARW